MKKTICMIFVVAFTYFSIGCTGLNVSTTANIATDTAFVLVLQNNPSYKPEVVKSLTAIKAILNNEITYDTLISEISKQLPAQYSAITVILIAYIDADKPVFETHLNLLDKYKTGIIAKIDHMILLAQ